MKLVASRARINRLGSCPSGPYLAHRFASTKRVDRTDIRSASLCHDVLEWLAPQLQSHRGCDLIDIKPGGDIWSDQLCKTIGVTRHVVVDEHEKIDHPHSEAATPIVRARSLQECLGSCNGFLSARNYGFDHCSYTKPNESILMTANLTARGLATSKYSGSSAAYFFNDLYASMFGLRDDVFRYGLINVLAWVPRKTARVLIPKGVDARNKLSVKLEAAFSMTEIAAPLRTDELTSDRRWADLDSENYRALHSASLAMLELRRVPAPLPMVASIKPDPKSLRAQRFMTGGRFIQEWLDLDEKLQLSHPKWLRTDSRRRHIKAMGDETNDMFLWRDYFRRAKANYTRHQTIASSILTQRNLESEFRNLMNLDAKKEAAQRRRIKEKAEKLRIAIASMSRDARLQIRKAIDDHRAYDACPRAMSWNNRDFDPLVVRQDEFSSPKPLTLILLQPKPEFRQTLDTDSKATCFEYVLNRLSQKWSASVQEALQDLLQDNVADFIHLVPSLTDPTKGGYFDLTDLRIRSLPVSTFLEIAIAYEKWPMRPDTTKMMFEMSQDTTFVPGDD